MQDSNFIESITNFENFANINFRGKSQRARNRKSFGPWRVSSFKVHLEIILFSWEKGTVTLEMPESNLFANLLATEMLGDFQSSFFFFFLMKPILKRFASGAKVKLKAFHSSLCRRVGVFFCGPAVLSHRLHQMSNKHSSGGTRFYYNKENF